MEKLVLIKVGGKIVEEEETLRQLLNDFAAIEGYKVLGAWGRTLGYQACRPTRVSRARWWTVAVLQMPRP